MAFPVDAAQATTNGSTATTNKACTLPTGIAAGNRLILVLRSAGADTHSLPTGWNWLAQNSTADASDDTTSTLYRVADGGEGTTVTVNGTASLKFAAACWRITGAGTPQTSVGATGTSGSPDPPSFSPTGGAQDYLWLWVGGWEGEQTSPPASNPTNYLNPVGANSGVGGAIPTNCRVAGASRQLNAATEDPPLWTISVSDDWTAWTVAVPPPPAASPTRGQLSWVELEAPFVATRGQVSWGELELPLAPTRGQLAWSEFEGPLTPTRGRVAWVELEVPSLASPTRGQISWVEAEVPFVGTRGQYAWTELEVPISPTRGRIAWVELETPLAPTRGRVGFVELEVPLVGTRGQVAWSEIAVPATPTRGQIAWAELELPFSGCNNQFRQITGIPIQTILQDRSWRTIYEMWTMEHTYEGATQRLTLRSPSGTLYRIAVNDDGTLNVYRVQ